jgi:hypothetical protein
VIYPIFLRAFGETGDPRAASDHLTKPTELLALMVPIVLGFSYLVLHLPILWLLPDFVPSITIYRLLTVTIAFQCLAILPGFYLMSIDRQNWLVPFGVGAIAFDFLVGRELIRLGWGLPGVAAAMGAGSFLYCTAVLLYACAFAMGSWGERLTWILKVYSPVLLFAAVVGALRWLVPLTPLGSWNEYGRASIEGLLFLALALPLLAGFEKRYRVIRRLRGGGSSAETS